MSIYNVDLPKEVDPKDLPLSNLAPCWAEGKVTTTDYDTKDAICRCPFKKCLVNYANKVIGTKDIKDKDALY